MGVRRCLVWFDAQLAGDVRLRDNRYRALGNVLTIELDQYFIEAYYYDLEQKHTWVDLKSKFKVKKHTTPTNSITIEFDASKLTQQAFNLLIQLPEIIADSGEIGTFELDIFKITIKDLNTYEDRLVHIYNK
jgi:hypothetical protein